MRRRRTQARHPSLAIQVQYFPLVSTRKVSLKNHARCQRERKSAVCPVFAGAESAGFDRGAIANTKSVRM